METNTLEELSASPSYSLRRLVTLVAVVIVIAFAVYYTNEVLLAPTHGFGTVIDPALDFDN